MSDILFTSGPPSSSRSRLTIAGELTPFNAPVALAFPFTPTKTGPLGKMEIVAFNHSPTSPYVEVALTIDANGRPGEGLEWYTIPLETETAATLSGPLPRITIESQKRPVLVAGRTYWLMGRPPLKSAMSAGWAISDSRCSVRLYANRFEGLWNEAPGREMPAFTIWAVGDALPPNVPRMLQRKGPPVRAGLVDGRVVEPVRLSRRR